MMFERNTYTAILLYCYTAILLYCYTAILPQLAACKVTNLEGESNIYIRRVNSWLVRDNKY